MASRDPEAAPGPIRAWWSDGAEAHDRANPGPRDPTRAQPAGVAGTVSAGAAVQSNSGSVSPASKSAR